MTHDFTAQGKVIIISYERKHDRSDLCFVTQGEILVLEIQMFFERTSKMLTCSNYCSSYIFLNCRNNWEFREICNFRKIIWVVR